MSVKIDDGYMFILLSAPFSGPRPGSNFLSYLCVGDEGESIDEASRSGERVEELVRCGYLEAIEKRANSLVINEASKEVEHLPEIEITHRYQLTPKGAEIVRKPLEGLEP